MHRKKKTGTKKARAKKRTSLSAHLRAMAATASRGGFKTQRQRGAHLAAMRRMRFKVP